MAQLSIVMPVFNRPDELKVMVDSILANTYQDWEMLAVDDGSDSDTCALLSQYADSDDRIKVVKRDRQPKGAQTCRNIGLEMSTGEFIVFFDSDDYITPQCLAQRVACLQQHPDMDFMVFPSALFHDGHFDTAASPYVFGYPINDDDLSAFAERFLPFIVWNNIYRRQALLDHKLVWDPQLKSLQDADFNIQSLTAGLRYDYAQALPDYGYRMGGRAGSVSKRIVTQEHFKSNLYALEKSYQTIQSRVGDSLDKQLYYGVLTVYNPVMDQGVNVAFADELIKMMSKYSPRYSRLLRLQVRISLFLGHFIAKKLARQVPMALFLIRRKYQAYRKRQSIGQLRK